MPLKDLLLHIDRLKAELDELMPMDKVYHDRLWQKLRLEWNYNSNHIEGNTLTYSETFLLLVHGRTTGDHTTREIDEMRAHNVAIDMVRDWAQDLERELLESEIRELNRIILKEPFWKEAITADGKPTQVQVVPGEYKKTANIVRQPDGTYFHYAKPEEVSARMDDLMRWSPKTMVSVNPLIHAAEWHHRFILIHPFADGNGRVARLVVNYFLLRSGLMPLVIKSDEKGRYLTALKKADAGDMVPFTEYLAEQAIWSLELAIKAAKGEEMEERKDWLKEAEVLYRAVAYDKRSAEAVEQEHRKRILETIRTNFEWIKDELSVIRKTFDQFYTGSSIIVQADPQKVGGFKEYKSRVEKAEVEQIVEWFSGGLVKDYLQFILEFRANRATDLKRQMIVLNWHFDHDVQRLHCVPVRQDEREGISYAVTFKEHPPRRLDDIGKWMVGQVRKAKAIRGL